MKKILGLVTILTLVLTGCYTPRYVYSPSAHNVPVLFEKNDSKISFNYSTNMDTRATNSKYDRNRANGYDVQAAYALTKNIGIQGSYFARKEMTYNNSLDNFFDSSVIRYKRSLFEFGIGYFTQIDTKQKVMFQIFGAVGFGKSDFTDTGLDENQLLYSRIHNAELTKYYLEPTISFRNKAVFAASLSTRFSLISFRNVKTNYSQREKEYFKLDSIGRGPSMFFEPAFVNSYGFNKLPGLRIEYQLGLSLLLSKNFIDYRRFNFSLGLVLDLPKLFKGPGQKNPK